MKTREIIMMVALLGLAMAWTVRTLDGTVLLAALVLVHWMYGKELYRAWYRWIKVER